MLKYSLLKTLRVCVTAARLTLAQFVRVQILNPQPKSISILKLKYFFYVILKYEYISLWNYRVDGYIDEKIPDTMQKAEVKTSAPYISFSFNRPGKTKEIVINSSIIIKSNTFCVNMYLIMAGNSIRRFIICNCRKMLETENRNSAVPDY